MGIEPQMNNMLGDFREYLLSTTSLKRHQTRGYRDILHIMLERYNNLDEIEPEHLESHEREALQKFKEFEKMHKDTKRRGMPVFG